MKTLFMVIYFDHNGGAIWNTILDHYPTDEEIKTLPPKGSITEHMYYANVEKRFYFI